MMSQSRAAIAATSHFLVAALVLCAPLVPACSGAATDRNVLRTGSDPNDEAGSSQSDDGTDGAAADQGPTGPVYTGKPVDDSVSDASASIAAPDGYCPITDSLGDLGINCPSCAESHCASPIAECDPTMVNSCTGYYCPTQCLQLVDAGDSAANACAKAMQCCGTLLGTSLGFQCLSINAASAASSCQGLLSQAQAMGRCRLGERTRHASRVRRRRIRARERPPMPSPGGYGRCPRGGGLCRRVCGPALPLSERFRQTRIAIACAAHVSFAVGPTSNRKRYVRPADETSPRAAGARARRTPGGIGHNPGRHRRHSLKSVVTGRDPSGAHLSLPKPTSARPCAAGRAVRALTEQRQRPLARP